jgi:hypothetical protein
MSKINNSCKDIQDNSHWTPTLMLLRLLKGEEGFQFKIKTKC